ncbi:MAG: hypothetical protein HY922_13335 [Elusimicrobia bacterium]|nr:hypothetical protein [Elusimicrobiota bacterium]
MKALDLNEVRKRAAWGLWAASLVGIVLTLGICIYVPVVPGLERRLLLIGWGMAALYAALGWWCYRGFSARA